MQGIERGCSHPPKIIILQEPGPEGIRDLTPDTPWFSFRTHDARDEVKGRGGGSIAECKSKVNAEVDERQQSPLWSWYHQNNQKGLWPEKKSSRQKDKDRC